MGHQRNGSVDASFLVGCNGGLLLNHHGQLTRLLNGPVYGITRRQGSWYALQRLGRSARIVRFEIDLSAKVPVVAGAAVIVNGLSVGVHQIDFVFDRLIVTDTYNNAIRIYRPEGRLTDIVYPLGALPRNDIFSNNYAHFNSVYWDGRDVLLVAHNNSLKTGRRSRIYVLDFACGDRVHCIVDDAGYGAHNVTRIDGSLMWCDSLNGNLVRDGEIVATIDGYMTRGLAVDAKYIIVGGSAYAFGKNRLASSGCVAIWNRNFELLDTISIAGSGGISEIRMLGDDLGLSAANAPEKLDSLWRNAG